MYSIKTRKYFIFSLRVLSRNKKPKYIMKAINYNLKSFLLRIFPIEVKKKIQFNSQLIMLNQNN